MGRSSFLNPNRLAARPVVLAGGEPLVPIPDGSTVHVDKSRWGVEVTLSPRPVAGQETWPRWPLIDQEAALKVGELLGRVNTEGTPLGYLGPEEARLEEEYAALIARNAPAGAPRVHVLAVHSGSAALEIVYKAILYKRYVVQKLPVQLPPEIVVQARTFEASWTAGFKAFCRVCMADVDSRNGCLDPGEAAKKIGPNTAILTHVALYDKLGRLGENIALARQHDLAIVLDAAHGGLITQDGIHVVYSGVDAMIESGQGSKVRTPGWEHGFIVTCDPVIAAYAMKLRNVARTPSPTPSWWPTEDLGDVLGGNERGGEITAILGSFDTFLRLAPQREQEIAHFRAALRQHPELPWKLLADEPGVAGLHYKVGLMFEPEGSSKPEPWHRIGHARAMEWMARELHAEVTGGYPTPDRPESEYHPHSVIWAPESLMPEIEPSRYPNAIALTDKAMFVCHEHMARIHAADQLLGALLKMHLWVDDPEVQAWATNP